MKKEEYLYLSFIVIFAFLILNFNSSLPVSFYSRGGEPLFPVVVGILATLISFLILNRYFGAHSTFFGLFLAITSVLFVSNFSKGSEIQLLSFSLNNLLNVLYLIPFSLFLIFYLAVKRDLRLFYPVACLISVFFSAFGVFLLASSCVAGIAIKEKKREYSAILSFLLLFTIILSLFSFSNIDIRAFAISALFAAILALVLFASGKDVNELLLACIIFTSILSAFSYSSQILTLDSTTAEIIEKMKDFENFSIISAYEEKINALINTNYEDGLMTFFADAKKVKYLAIDKEIIAKPYYYSSKINVSPQFETFELKKKIKTTDEFGNEYYIYYYYSEKSELILIGNEDKIYKAYLNGAEADPSDLFKFNEYMILPKKRGSALKILFPENFGGNATKIFENERYLVYEIGQK
jgi:hypothetical protein